MILNNDITISEETETTKTYHLLSDKIQGYAENITAIKQAIYKMLDTEQYEYPIYSFSYGIQLEDLIGKDQAYVKVELKRRIEECLLSDDRISSVGNFTYSFAGDSLACSFDVVCIYGTSTITKEVAV